MTSTRRIQARALSGVAACGLFVAATTSCSSLLKSLDSSYGGAGPEEMYGPSAAYEADASSRAVSGGGGSGRGPASAAAVNQTGNTGSSWGAGGDEDYTSRPSAARGGAEGYVDEVAFSNTNYVQAPVKRQYRSGGRASRSDFIDDSSNEGSLWGSSGQTNYYFTKNKIRNIGDILTLTIEDEIVREVAQEVRRTLTVKEKKAELLLAQERLRRAALGIEDPADKAMKDAKAKNVAGTAGRAPAAAAPGAGDAASANKDAASKKAAVSAPPGTTPASEIMVPRATLADINVTKSLLLNSGENMLVEVVNRYPNGNYRVRGTKRIPYRNGQRILKIAAIVRGTDVSDDDTIASGKLFEARYEVIR